MGPEAPPYANSVIISPHIYPASVIPRGCTGKALCNRLSNSWGYLQVKVRPWHMCRHQQPCRAVLNFGGSKREAMFAEAHDDCPCALLGVLVFPNADGSLQMRSAAPDLVKAKTNP